MSFDETGRGFAEQWRACFAGERGHLAGVYGPTSLLTWNGTQLQGVDSIMNHLLNLNTGAVIYGTVDIDCHPLQNNGVMIVSNGELKMNEEDHSLSFNDVIVLAVSDAGQYYVANQIFRILGGGSV